METVLREGFSPRGENSTVDPIDYGGKNENCRIASLGSVSFNLKIDTDENLGIV